MRINAGARANGLSYNQFIAGLKARTSSSTGRCSPTSRSPIRRSSARSPSRQRRRSPQTRPNRASSRDLPAPGRLLRRPLAALRSAVPPARGAIRGSDALCARPALGSAAAAARRACTTSCSPGRPRGTTSTRRSTGTPVPRALVRRAGGADERGAAGVGAPARVPVGGRRPAARPARARAVGRAEPRLGPLPLRLLDGRRGATSRARARRRRPRAAARRAASSGGVEVARRRGIDRSPVDVDHRARRATAAVVRLGRPDRAGSSGCAARSTSCARTRPS